MAQERPSNRREPDSLNWLGKTVYVGGTLLRHTANLIDATARRVSKVAAESKRAFDRELDPNIEEARVIEETPLSEASTERTSDGSQHS